VCPNVYLQISTCIFSSLNESLVGFFTSVSGIYICIRVALFDDSVLSMFIDLFIPPIVSRYTW
jgi:hypothetical protein